MSHINSVFLFVVFLVLCSHCNAGVFLRGNQKSEYSNSRLLANQGAEDVHLFGRTAPTEKTTATTTANAATNRSGLSAWGIIALVILFILFGVAGYYIILCYPIICMPERNYYTMDTASTSSGTPTRSTDFEKFEKMGNYSSRSTTPSKSNE